jgi:hypothetical protein
MIQTNLGVIPAVIEEQGLKVQQAEEFIVGKGELWNGLGPERRGYKEQAPERRTRLRLAEELEQDRGSEGVSHQDRAISFVEELRDPVCPGPVVGIIGLRHAWCLYPICWSKPVTE